LCLACHDSHHFAGRRCFDGHGDGPHERPVLLGCPDYARISNYQQYLAKNPFGYRRHANTGVKLPAIA
jgi:hypothetical protein